MLRKEKNEPGQTRGSCCGARDARQFLSLGSPPLVSATGQLMAADREAVINLSPKLRTLGLPPYVIVHGRDPESVAVMTALRLRGAASPTEISQSLSLCLIE